MDANRKIICAGILHQQPISGAIEGFLVRLKNWVRIFSLFKNLFWFFRATEPMLFYAYTIKSLYLNGTAIQEKLLGMSQIAYKIWLMEKRWPSTTTLLLFSSTAKSK